MPHQPSAARPPIGPTSRDSSNPSPPTGRTPASDSRAAHPVDPKAPRRLELPNLMLLIADPATGALMPEYRQEADDLRLDLEPETLVPAWWPRENPDGQPLLPRLRVQSFRWELLQAVEALEASASGSAKPPKGSGSATPAETSSRPRLILQSLRQFRSALPPDSDPTPD